MLYPNLTSVFAGDHWQCRTLQNIQDSNWGDRAGRQSDIQMPTEVDTHDASGSNRSTPRKPATRTTKSKLKNALSPDDMAQVLHQAELAESRNLRATRRQKTNPHEEATRALLQLATHSKKGKAPKCMPFSKTIIMSHSTFADYSGNWQKAIQTFGKVPLPGDEACLPSGERPAESSRAAIAGIIPAEPMKTRAMTSQWSEPSWEKRTIPPTVEQAMHLWAFRKEAARGFLAVTKALMSLERDASGQGILTADKQLLMLIIGEAGVGKSHLIRAICWFAHQHDREADLVLTSFQGRPVSRLRNPAVRGQTTSTLYQVNSREGHSAREEQRNIENLQTACKGLCMEIQDEFSLTGADHFSTCSAQAVKGLSHRAIRGLPFGGLHKIMVGDPMQHTPVDSKPLWFGQASGPAQAAIANMQSQFQFHTRRIDNVMAGVALFRQFTTVSNLLSCFMIRNAISIL